MNQGTKIVAVVLFVLFVGTGVYYVTLSPAKPATPSSARAGDPAAARPAAPRDPGSITMNPPPATGSALAPAAPRIADPLASGAAAASSPVVPNPSSTAGAADAVPNATPTATTPNAPRVTLGPGGAPASVMAPLAVTRGPSPNVPISGSTPSGVPSVRPTSPPASATPATAVASGSTASTSNTAGPREHTVASGETLSSIAARYLGSEARWEEIARANPGINPSSMRVGTKLAIPAAGSATTRASAAPSAPAAPAAAGNEYVVKAGDTLTGIARATLGNADWESIYEANRSVIGPNPAALKVGMRLSIPKRS